MTTVAIMQPTYLGWCGYFDMLDQADVFVLLDTVAVSPKSWQTRNRIRARDGNVVWLSVPTNARRGMPLNEVRVADEHHWAQKHYRQMRSAFRNHAPHWAFVCDALAVTSLYGETEMLSLMNQAYVMGFCEHMGIGTSVVRASILGPTSPDPVERIRQLCERVGATELLNTPGAREWLEGHDVGVPVRWHHYEHPQYRQGDAPWCSHLSVVDLLAWHGPDSLRIIRSGRASPNL